ncbi:glycosyltransferase family 2 protein [Xylophilus sp. ASV27]|uniref:glycosyltransferase family 2 protein n=1 Tax=Xylophilus sp. ASV27 TaxID=2795129 RepID=UPI0018EE2BAD|nr:glycosyltransferase family 2 protein [Xylophilus sp. ASV27]
MQQKLISIIVPAYNEEAVLDIFHERISAVLASLPDYAWEIIFINDGSTDATQSKIEALQRQDPRVGCVLLSRNFGKEIAMTAGLDHAKGDAVVIIDADLQDPPELMADFIREWKNGYDVVYGRRTHRDGESWAKKATARYFYQVIGKLSKVQIPANTGDFRLMSRRAVDALLQLREHHRFMKGLFAWVGYPSIAVEYRRPPRAAGVSKFNYWKLWNFALEGITSFTILPLKLATYLGVFIALFSVLAGSWIILKTLLWGERVAGYPTLIVTILFFGGVQLFFIGVIGEYLGRIYNETKVRPLYVVQEVLPPGTGKSRAANTS